MASATPGAIESNKSPQQCYFCLETSDFGVERLLVRPKTIVFGRTYVLVQMFYLFFLHLRDLRDACSDRREILHDGQY